ncbi:MAG: hypothetical protein A2792_00105 [Sphingomonadales bacterium RIFCSPHIGHO2_01_FULL_65_20]|nr:MAG: hypothetical protein A2792_00105 [Sphingomonadales bacterium RIFCSPHIGHO2_01_FULL_65_20]
MKKPETLRAAIAAAVPDLADNPDRLIMWIDRGAVASPGTPSFNFTYSYRLNIFIVGYAGQQPPVAIAILHWLRVNQPDLLQPGKDAFSFEADFLDNKSVDLQIELQLTECVTAIRREDGGFDMQFIAEPDPLFDDDLLPGGLDEAPALSQIWFDGERLLPGPPLP